MKFLNKTVFIAAICLITSCGLSPLTPTLSAEPLNVNESEAESENSFISSEEITPSPSLETKIPLDQNKKVQFWINYFTVKDRERLVRFLNRGQKYKEVVQNTLKENDLPEDLYYLAMIESGFQTHARSSAQAVGVWQFISGTAHRYGLKIDRYVDERKDPIRATEAATKYLRDLYNVFGSWHLAMAAYNAGEMRIVRAIFKARTRNFWELVDAKALPRETAEYIPKFIAMTLIAKNPDAYNLKIDEDVINYPSLRAIEVPGALSLTDLAKLAEIELSSISYVNPHLKQHRTPPNTATYEVWVPIELADKVQNSYAKFKIFSKTKQQPVISNTSKTYVVKRGDNLASIAKRYKMTVGHLKRINSLKSDKILVGKRLKTYSTVYIAKTRPKKYIVRRGDNLNSIAKKFNITIKKIKSMNKLTQNNIFAGQVLKMHN